MFKNHLKIAFRYFFRQKTYSIINILGLAVGIAATLLILAYIEFELSYDNFHRNADSLYRVSITTLKEGKVEFDSPEFIAPMGPTMMSEFPEVENVVRIADFDQATLSSGEHVFRIPHMVYADSSFFDLLSFELLAGDPKRVLVAPYSVVLSEEAAAGLFGSNNPVGQMIKVNNQESFRVSGVVKAPPANSHIQFSVLLSFSTLEKDPTINRFLGWDGGNRYIAYVRLRSNSRPEDVEKKLPAFIWSHLDQEFPSTGLTHRPYLQPFSRIHLYYEGDSESTRTNLYVFAVVALFILLIACVNFVNLTTARAVRRSKEIGIRKVLGADRSKLVNQFLSETILITFFASLAAIVLVELALPTFRNLLGKDTISLSFFEPKTILALVGIIFIVGVVAGSYPAFYLSSLQASQTLKGPASETGKKGRLRGVLIVLQFAISIALIVCTVIVGSQLRYLKNKDLGFNRENIVTIPLTGDDAQLKSMLLKQEFLRIPDVVRVSASSAVPYNDFTSNGYFPEGQQTVMMIHVVDVDDDFLSTYGMTIVDGRYFSKDFPSDKKAYVVNQTLARTLSWSNPVGKKIMRNEWHQIIGVVRDFNYAKLNNGIDPLILTHEPWRDRYDNLSIKIRSANTAGTLGAIKDMWNNLVPSTPFEYAFLDEQFDRLYKSEERFEQTFFSFSALAIVIALLGLLSLASLATQQRTKEIGIRKVLGASALSVTGLLSGDFLRWVALANILAWPAAYYFVSQWLQDFAYRVDVTVWPFFAAAVASLLLGWLAVSFQAIRAAMANPVEALRYE